MSNPQTSPLTARLYDLEYPRSLGVYSTYAEVQTVVDTLADAEFPVQHTMIVGTDLKLIERVTGRKTWGRTIRNGVLSGLWMGLFMGLLFVLLTGQPLVMLLTTVIMGIIFFTVWSAVGYAASGGKRDFTSMTATIPMQYELMVEHTHAGTAREILAAHGTAVPATPPRRLQTPSPGTPPAPPSASVPAPPSPDSGPAAGPGNGGSTHRPTYGRPAAPPAATPAAAPTSPRPSYGRPAQSGPSAPVAPASSPGAPSSAAPGPSTPMPTAPASATPAPPAPAAPSAPHGAAPSGGRSYGYSAPDPSGGETSEEQTRRAPEQVEDQHRS